MQNVNRNTYRHESVRTPDKTFLHPQTARQDGGCCPTPGIDNTLRSRDRPEYKVLDFRHGGIKS